MQKCYLDGCQVTCYFVRIKEDSKLGAFNANDFLSTGQLKGNEYSLA